VSNVVNAPDRVAPDTLERVQREIARLGFRPSRAAQQLKKERAGAWGVEIDSLGFGRLGAVLDSFLVSLTIGSRRHGSHIVPFAASDPQDPIPSYEDMVASRIADGFVLTDTRHDDPRPAWLDAHGVPYAAFGRVWDDPSVTSWVDVDGCSGVATAVHHLAHQGYERIGFLGWPEGSPVGDDRRSGWARATAELGLAHLEWAAATHQVVESACAAAGPLIDALGRGAALVCASDALALCAWRVLMERGMRPGTDFGLVGFDDTDVARALDLTSLRQPLDEAADHVLYLLGIGAEPHATATRGVLLSPELVIRSSSKPAGDRTNRKEK
jgi:DNA-binding LacI/PurR family transcriptional regulator